MTLIERKQEFEKTNHPESAALLRFIGVDGLDVYNCSIPFVWDGKEYIYGRVEKRDEWARSTVRLFQKSGEDEWTVVPDTMIYQLEDPYIAFIGEELVLGGTHVVKRCGGISTYYGYFYRGVDLHDLVYFATGPDYMKDIRLVGLDEGKIGVFSRPRNAEILEKFGSESQIGFTVINSLDELTADVIENAPYIEGIFGEGEWGGCNQAYTLSTGLIGAIGHKCYRVKNDDGLELLTYINISFVFDPDTHRVVDEKIIGTKSSYPEAEPKRPALADCAFTSGIVLRPDGKADLYSGIGDSFEGRVVIENPFDGFGEIVTYAKSVAAAVK